MTRSSWIGVVLSFVVLALTAYQPSVSITRAATTNPMLFAVIGDYGVDNSNEAAVASLVKSWNPNFIITVGDNNYPDGAQTTIDNHIGKYYAEYIFPYSGGFTNTATINRFFPSLGNHDWYTTGATPYLNYFTLPGNERYYDFVQGDVHFFALDSDPNEPDGNSSSSTQAEWLYDHLASSTSCWNLVYFHHAPYSSGPHGLDPNDPGRNMTWQFKSWGADAVFSGHDHDYERIEVNGIPYFVDGSGGAALYPFAPSFVSGSQAHDNSHWGAIQVVASPTRLRYEFIATDGTVLDTYTQNGNCSIFLPLVTK